MTALNQKSSGAAGQISKTHNALSGRRNFVWLRANFRKPPAYGGVVVCVL